MNPTLLAAGLSREIIELDISSITSTNETYELSDDENELSPALLPQASAFVFYLLIKKINFLFVFVLVCLIEMPERIEFHRFECQQWVFMYQICI